jgi:Trk K+ transport system NAD-binding subunit
MKSLRQRLVALRRKSRPPKVQNALDIDKQEDSQTLTVVFLVMRKMRIPLLVLVSSYTISIFGMIIIPGIDVDGKPHYMNLFDAFYFVSYTATTIGFGEVPYTFSYAQRLWAIFTIYLTVVSWFYAIGSLVTLMQNEALNKVITKRRFARIVRQITQPFYIICGYGDTGRALVHSLQQSNIQTVVIELRQERFDLLLTENHHIYIPKLHGNARRPERLLQAGLHNPDCAGVIALTNDNFVNLHIAITTRLLNPNILSIARVDSHDVSNNMASFGTDYMINPFDIFARRFHIALNSPSLYILYEWLSGRSNCLLCEPIRPPNKGLWIICGYGRFGKAIYERLKTEEDIEIVVIEATPERTGYPKCKCVVGRGTEAVTLQEAFIERAVGMVAATDDDVNNLSIIMTARDLNKNIFTILRQNMESNGIICDAAKVDIIMQPSRLIADHIRVLTTIPLLVDFIVLAKMEDETWASDFFIKHLSNIISDISPEIWEVKLNKEEAPALSQFFADKKTILFKHLLHDPIDHKKSFGYIPLLLIRSGRKILLPDENFVLRYDDHILCCGNHKSCFLLDRILHDSYILSYNISGKTPSQGYVWKLLNKKFNKMSEMEHHNTITLKAFK